MPSMSSSVTLAPPIPLPRRRADSCPSSVRSRIYSRSMPDIAGEHGEDDAARVMAALEVAGEELQADAARARIGRCVSRRGFP